MFSTPHALFRTFGIAEAISWTLLISGMILRSTHDLDIAVSIGGGIHGFVFLAYAVTAILVAKNQRWSAGPTSVAIISAVIPYATIPADIWLTRSHRLDGHWRRESTGTAQDEIWHDKALRTVLRKPLLSAGVAFAAVAFVFAALLIIGPPFGD